MLRFAYAPTISPTRLMTASSSGNWFVSFLEWMTAPFTATSKTPPEEGRNVNAPILFLKSWSSVSAKLTARSRYPQAVQYSMEIFVSVAMNHASF